MAERCNIRTGSEGPKHDPYSFTEYSASSLTNPDLIVTLHMGLAEWLMVGCGTKRMHANENHGFEGGIVAEFKRLTGRDPYEDEEEHFSPKCSDHPDADVESMEGYPGESFAVCSVCRKILDSYFNEAAII